MSNAKFTMNSLVIIAIIFSAILFFFTIAMVDMANPYAQNEFYPIEGTDELAIKHSSIEPNGIYRGGENTAVLVLEGTYGKDWGTTLAGEKLYLNEYDMTTVGMIIPEIVRVDINTLEKEILYKDAMIRGRCASGEMVCLEGYVMPSNFPETNSLLKFYSMSEKDLNSVVKPLLEVLGVVVPVLLTAGGSAMAFGAFAAAFVIAAVAAFALPERKGVALEEA